MIIKGKTITEGFRREDTKTDNYWLYRCLMRSMSTEMIEKTRNKGKDEDKDNFDVKLIINGVEVEPTFLQDLVKNVVKHIDESADDLMKKKFQEAKQRLWRLDEIVDDACSAIRKEFNIPKDEDDY